MFSILREIKSMLDADPELARIAGVYCLYANEKTTTSPFIVLQKNSIEANVSNKQYTELKGSVAVITVSKGYDQLIEIIDYINDNLHMKKTPSGYHIEFMKMNNEIYVPEDKIFVSELIYNII